MPQAGQNGQRYELLLHPKRSSWLCDGVDLQAAAQLRLGHHPLHAADQHRQDPSAAQPAEEHGQNVGLPAHAAGDPDQVQE